MKSKNDALDEILLHTNGLLLYSEQILEIGMNVLGLSLQESNNMRKDFGKNVYALSIRHINDIRNKIEDEDLSERLIFLMEHNASRVVSKVYIDMYNKIYKNTIQEVLSVGSGALIYEYQVYVLLTEVAKIPHHEVEKLLNGEEQSLNSVISNNLYHFPEISSTVVNLIKHHRGGWEVVPIHLIPYLDTIAL